MASLGHLSNGLFVFIINFHVQNFLSLIFYNFFISDTIKEDILQFDINVKYTCIWWQFYHSLIHHNDLLQSENSNYPL